MSDELADCLPLSDTAIAGLDKTSIMRIAIAYVKLRTLLGPGQYYLKIHTQK